MTASQRKNGGSSDASVIHADIIVVGGGFGGVDSLIRLRDQGLTVKLLEAGGDFGGVWYWNEYPGARVDSDMPAYQFSHEAAWKGFNFTEKFPGWKELQSYFHHVDKTYDLRKDAIFNARVNGIERSKSDNKWNLTIEDGRKASCTYLILATGTTNKAYMPNFEGREKFQGQIIHPARWPHDLDVKGKKVALMGIGACGLQIAQEIGEQDCQMTLFIRNPTTALPMGQREITGRESEDLKFMYDAIFDVCKHRSWTGFAHNLNKKSFYETTPEERRELLERLWKQGSFAIFNSFYREFAFDRKANAELYQFWREQVRARMTDPKKMDIMAPEKQPYPFASKRPSLEMHLWETLDRPNVEIVSVKETPIKRMNEKGFVTDQGNGEERQHDFDIVIFATGFDNVTGSLYDMNIKDKNGVLLQEKWKDGILTNLGMMVPDMPNLFMLYGPQAPTSLANGPPFLERQTEWVDRVIKGLKEKKANEIETTVEAANAWKKRHLDIAEKTFYPEADSWYVGANIPGKRREMMIYVGGMQDWWSQCERAIDGFQDFKVSQGTVSA
ncbi:Flavin-binding monooxygenase-like protein 8 [Elsinoe fawcettii]|nr:Flavin-binding monooxygenase-like protein 8 [Elsinoe fawcettii]